MTQQVKGGVMHASDLQALPVEVRADRTVRVKILDACGMTCTFCHNEGTPVAANVTGSPSTSGRVSIYLKTNGAKFMPARMEADDQLVIALAALKGTLATEAVHLTGGEPTLHPHLADLVRLVRSLDLEVAMTSNGENGAAVLPAAAEAGLSRANFSVFGTTPADLASVQHARFRSTALAIRKLDALRASIETALACDVATSINVVVPGPEHIDRINRLIAEQPPAVVIRLLNSLADGQVSIDAVEAILANLHAQPIRRILIAGSSRARVQYLTPDGRNVYFKQIRPVRLPVTCATCRFNNDTDCQEGYYGLRLYRAKGGPFMVGVCIQRMDLCMPLEKFVASDLAREIRGLRAADSVTPVYART